MEGGKMIAVGLIAAIILCVGFILYTNYEAQQLHDKVQEKIYEGYEVYVDGRLVEADSINLRYYNIDINDDARKIILTKKENYGSRNNIMPVIIPRS